MGILGSGYVCCWSESIIGKKITFIICPTLSWIVVVLEGLEK